MSVTAEKKIGPTKRPTDEELLRSAERGGSLLNGRILSCPACEHACDLLEYIPLHYSEKYADQVIAPLVCRSCKHIFALRP
jgi:uncharacterized protein YbaR (Trm112 family)